VEPDGAAPSLSRDEEVATALMRMALVLLDRDGTRPLVAARLQHATDTLVLSPTMTAEEVEARWLGMTEPGKLRES
jgi:hypothetical protein